MKTKMIFGTVILMMAASLAGCEKKDNTPYGSAYGSAPTGNGTSPYTGPCDMALTQNQQNHLFISNEMAVDAAHAVAEHGENGLVDVPAGWVHQDALKQWRTPTSDPVESCSRRSSMALYTKTLNELKTKK